MHENTYDGLLLYVDDLVTDDAQRSRGIGKILLDHLQRIAHASGCRTFQLDSGTQRQQAHKFYFREGMVVTSFHFRKSLESVRASIG
jgi:ribosomal protein S18 acetylase RimI-like enzyme